MTIFNFYTDAALQSSVSTVQANHLASLGGDDVDFAFYLGSTSTGLLFRASSNPGVDNIVVTPTNKTPLWLASTAYVVNDSVRTTAKNGFRYKAQSITGTGTTGGSEPVWPTTVGATVVDNEVTWVNDGKLPETTDIKLAQTALGLDAAVAGDPLPVGTAINGGSAGAVTVHVRVSDSINEVGFFDEIGLLVDAVEVSVV